MINFPNKVDKNNELIRENDWVRITSVGINSEIHKVYKNEEGILYFTINKCQVNVEDFRKNELEIVNNFKDLK